MNLEPAACYLCKSSDSAPWGFENGFSMVKCASCGLVYLNPRPSLDEIDEAAKTGLHKFAAGALNAVGRYSKRKVRDYEEKLRELIPPAAWSDSTSAWLDIGTGYGELIAAVRNLGMAKAMGIEPCEPKVEKARAQGLPVESRRLADIAEQFAYISLVNVYSHLPDPVEFLSELRPLFREDGRLVLVTGNGGDIPREEFPGALYLPDHLSFAGETNLDTVLERSGFRIEAVNRYPAIPSFDNPVVGMAKNVVRRWTGRPVVPLRFPESSRFRSLWLLARMV